MKYYDQTEIPRRYWTIGQVAEQLNVAPSLLRFWQTEFGFYVRRDKNGDRQFTAAEFDKVREIYRLLKVELYTIAGAKRQLAKATNHMDEISTALNVMP